MKNLEEIHDCEIDMVAENPDVLGHNIDSKFIIWPERRAQAIRAKEFLDSGWRYNSTIRTAWAACGTDTGSDRRGTLKR